MNKKAFLAKLLDNSFILQLKARFSLPNLMVFNYHRIYKSPLNTLFDEGVFAHSEDVFYKQMVWIKNNFNIISEQQLIEKISTGEWFTENTAMITFDDGYVDNYELAYPILNDLKIPATFFIACDQINDTAIPWWDQVAFVVRSSEKNEFEYAGKIYRKSAGDSQVAIKAVLKTFKEGHYDVGKQLKLLSLACNVDLPSSDLVKKQFMNWDQIRELSKNNHAIGSHTMSHRILSSLSEDDQRIELLESRLLLEKKLEQPINSISYPVGGHLEFTETTKRLVKETGYKLAFSFIGGGNESWESMDLLSIKRTELSQDTSHYKAQALMSNIF